MTLRKNSAHSLAVALLLVTAFAGQSALAAIVDYVGFGWETGELEVSEAGDELTMAFVVTQIDDLFGIELGLTEATIFIEGLVSEGQATDSDDVTTITYTGGTLRLYADPSFDSDWGVEPTNATVPSTFVNGDLVFEGAFTAFTLVMMPGGGAFEGFLDGTGGSALMEPCTDCAYTFGGTFSNRSEAQIPAGYDLQIDGILDVESAVATEDISFDGLKALYR